MCIYNTFMTSQGDVAQKLLQQTVVFLFLLLVTQLMTHPNISPEHHLHRLVVTKAATVYWSLTRSMTGFSSSLSIGWLVLWTHVLVHRCLRRTYEFLKTHFNIGIYVCILVLELSNTC